MTSAASLGLASTTGGNGATRHSSRLWSAKVKGDGELDEEDGGEGCGGENEKMTAPPLFIDIDARDS